MATPLTDGINALTAYANEVTGASDTNLSDAVHTLASGYGGGIVDGLFEVKHKITLNANTNELILPYFGTGLYVVITSPLLTSQMAIANGSDYQFQSGSFVIYGNSFDRLSFANGQSYLYQKNGSNDYWGVNSVFTDGTKTSISFKIGNGSVTFDGGLDYYILMPKES